MDKNKQQNPWTKISTEVVYKNAWIKVREDQVIRPDGTEGIYGVVETRIATAVAALTPQNTIYLVGQYRYPMEEYSWEIIQGGTDPGEDSLGAAKRELREEAGLIANTWEQLGGEVHLSNCHSDERGLIYTAKELSVTAAQPDCTEVLEIREVPLPKAVEMVENGEIKDAMSIIGILRAAGS